MNHGFPVFASLTGGASNALHRHLSFHVRPPEDGVEREVGAE